MGLFWLKDDFEVVLKVFLRVCPDFNQLLGLDSLDAGHYSTNNTAVKIVESNVLVGF
jgi:hypothetical protein